MIPRPATTAPSPRAADLAALCEHYRVTILYVVGSRADEVAAWLRDGQRTLAPGGSDVDIGVLVARDRTMDIEAKVRLAQAFEDWLGVDLVDLVTLHDADPFLAANVIRGERLYAQSQDDADEFDLYVLRRAGDLAPFERERMRLVLAARERSGDDGRRVSGAGRSE